MMLGLFNGFIFLFSIGCFLMILAKMWEEDQQILAIVCFFFCGIGQLITFVIGWVNVKHWECMPIMITWTICAVVNVIISILVTGLGG